MMAVRLGIGIEPAQHRIQDDDQFVAERIELLGRLRVIVATLFSTE
jgi:hypothetical protein